MVMDGATMVRIDRKSSIESEPRTLSFNQIQCAREAALYVMSTRSMEEAMNIFTEGLKPVASVPKLNGDSLVMDSDKYECRGGEFGLRDVASAPF